MSDQPKASLRRFDKPHVTDPTAIRAVLNEIAKQANVSDYKRRLGITSYFKQLRTKP